MRYGFVTLPRDINKALIIGVVVAGLIAALVPDDYFSTILGGGFLSMIVMMLVGIPVYVCATASVPIAAALIMKGVSPGAALVFLMTGPATNAATISTIWKTMGRSTAGIYLGTVAVASILAGLMLDGVISSAAGTAMHGPHWMLSGEVKTAAAFVLLGVLLAAFVQPSRVGKIDSDAGRSKKTKIRISGMSCGHCAGSVQRVLMEIGGVESAEVDYRKGYALVAGAGFDREALRSAVESLGYGVSGFEEQTERE